MNLRFNNKVFVSCLSALFLLMSGMLHAQTTTVGNEEVVIVKERDVKIKDADKISQSPNIPSLPEQKINLDYKIPSFEFKEISFEPNPLKPIAISREKKERFNSSYIKLGFGSQLSPLFEFRYNGKSKNLKYGVDLNHFNAMAFDIKNQRFFDDRAGAYVRYYPKTFVLGADFRFQNYITHFYGNQKAETLSRKQIRQTFQDFDGTVLFGSSKKNTLDIDFISKVRFDYFRELAGNSNEYFINGQIGIGKQIKKMHWVGGSFEFDGSQFTSVSQKLWRNYFLLNLTYKINYKDLIGRAGITLAVEGDKLYPLADLYVQKGVYKKYITAYAGWQMTYTKNSFRNFALENNFMLSDIQLRNSRKSDIFFGLKGTAKSFSYSAMFSYKDIRNMPFYYNDYFDSKRFYVGYDDKVRVINGHLELGYNFSNDFTALLELDYNNYKLSSNEKAWYRPDFLANLKLRYNLKSKLIFGADIYGFTNYYGHVSIGDIRQVKGTVDANLSLEYIFNKKFSFFGYLNNLAHQKYQRWANYPVFGINGIVGAKFSF
jgi:hypothetical protein